MFDALVLILVALAGGALPLLVKWNERQLHTALALSTGIFLGAVFLHLLPSLSSMSAALAESAARGDGDPAADGSLGTLAAHGSQTWIWLTVLVGVLGVYLVEALLLRTHDHDDQHRHRAVGYASLVGLSVHALTAGIGYAAASRDAALSTTILVAILAHKGFETFSLTTVFQLAHFGRARSLATIAVFSLITPAGILLGKLTTGSLGPAGVALFTALAAGTFLYVCLCELLVEVFHHREDSLRKIALLALGIGMTVVFEWVGHG